MFYRFLVMIFKNKKISKDLIRIIKIELKNDNFVPLKS